MTPDDSDSDSGYTGSELATWLQESGRRKAPKELRDLYQPPRPSDPEATPSLVRQPRLLILFAFMAAAFAGHWFIDVGLKIDSLPSIVFFIAAK
jgi:hypothetical protein